MKFSRLKSSGDLLQFPTPQVDVNSPQMQQYLDRLRPYVDYNDSEDNLVQRAQMRLQSDMAELIGIVQNPPIIWTTMQDLVDMLNMMGKSNLVPLVESIFDTLPIPINGWN